MRLRASIFTSVHNHRRKFHDLFFFSTIEPNQNSQSFNKTLQKSPNHFLPQFLSLAKTLNQNPRDFKSLSKLNSLLSHTQLFDSCTSTAIIEGLCQLKKLNRAKDLISHLKDNLKVSPYFAFSLVFDCLVKDGKLDDVEVQWGEISKGYGINLSNYVIYVCKFCDLDEIKNVCSRVLMGSRVLGRQCYVALIGVLCNYNEGLMAKLVLNEMYCRGFKINDVTYIVLFQCFCRIGDLDNADWVLRKFIKEGFDVDVSIYGSFMQGLTKLGKFREARKLCNKLLNRDCVSGSKDGLLKRGRRMIFQLNYKGGIPEMMVYEMYFRALCDAQKLDDAELLLKKMLKSRFAVQVCVYGCFVRALFRAGREEDALKFFEIECKKGLVCSDELARYVIVELCESGEVDKAMKVFDEFRRKDGFVNTVMLCNVVLSSLWNAGKAIEVEKRFEEMKNGNLEPADTTTYRLMVSGFCNQGNARKTLDLFEEMQSKRIPIDRFVYEAVITALRKQGLFAEAYKLMECMTRSESIVSYTVWKRVFYSLMDNGD
ncbi:unnamed protein product [Amaranthus hypochondriacus]